MNEQLEELREFLLELFDDLSKPLYDEEKIWLANKIAHKVEELYGE